MAAGPGKYDPECTLVRERAGVPIGGPGGVIVIVIGGDRGPGFACQADEETTRRLPAMLEHIARQIRADMDKRAN